MKSAESHLCSSCKTGCLAELVVTMGCSVEEVCPRPMLAQMRKKLVDWNLDDPKGRSIEEARRIRDEIQGKVKELTTNAN